MDAIVHRRGKPSRRWVARPVASLSEHLGGGCNVGELHADAPAGIDEHATIADGQQVARSARDADAARLIRRGQGCKPMVLISGRRVQPEMELAKKVAAALGLAPHVGVRRVQLVIRHEQPRVYHGEAPAHAPAAKDLGALQHLQVSIEEQQARGRGVVPREGP